MRRVNAGSLAGFFAFTLGLTEPLAGKVDEGAHTWGKVSRARINGVEPSLLIFVVGEQLHQTARLDEPARTEGG